MPSTPTHSPNVQPIPGERIDAAIERGDFSDFEAALSIQPSLCVRALMRLCHAPRLASDRSLFIAKLMGYRWGDASIGKACQIAARCDNPTMLGALGARCPVNMSPLFGLARVGNTACFGAFWPHATFRDRNEAFYHALVAGRTDIALLALEISTDLFYAGKSFSDGLVEQASWAPRPDPATLDAVLGWAASQAEHLALRAACLAPKNDGSPNGALRV